MLLLHDTDDTNADVRNLHRLLIVSGILPCWRIASDCDAGQRGAYKVT